MLRTHGDRLRCYMPHQDLSAFTEPPAGLLTRSIGFSNVNRLVKPLRLELGCKRPSWGLLGLWESILLRNPKLLPIIWCTKYCLWARVKTIVRLPADTSGSRQKLRKDNTLPYVCLHQSTYLEVSQSTAHLTKILPRWWRRKDPCVTK